MEAYESRTGLSSRQIVYLKDETNFIFKTHTLNDLSLICLDQTPGPDGEILFAAFIDDER